jgi:hypothetical protein
MLIQSKIRRTYWRNVLWNFVPDLLVAAIIAYALYGRWWLSKADGGRWWIFIIVYFGLQVVYLLIWLKNTIWGRGMFYLLRRREARQHFLSIFREKSFPEPDDIIVDGDDYFREVIENKAAPDEARVEAAGIMGALAYLRGGGQMQQSMWLLMILEDAIQLYKATFSSPASKSDK